MWWVSLPRNILAGYYGPPARLYVILGDKEIVGLVGFKRSGDSAEILHIVVYELFRHRGISRQVLDWLIALQGLTVLTAETDRDAVEFYRRYGFSIISLGELYTGVILW